MNALERLKKFIYVFRQRILSKTTAALILISITGIGMRIYFSNNSVRYLLWDTLTNQDIAWQIHEGKIAVDPRDKTIGYPVFLSAIYSFVGLEGIETVRQIQIVLDCINALLLMAVAKMKYGKAVAIVAYCMYMLNPFTASYVGLLLAEILTLFLFSSILLIISRNNFKRTTLAWLLFGFFVGLLSFTRMQFSLFGIICLTVFCFIYQRGWRKIAVLTVVLGMFLFANAYTVWGNWEKYNIISLHPPYGIGFAALYLNFYQDFVDPTLYDPKNDNEFFGQFDPTYWTLVRMYYSTPYEEMAQFRAKYTDLFWRQIQTEWPIFLKISLKNMYRMWDKTHLSYYYDPLYPADSWIVRIVNILLLAASACGLGIHSMKMKLKVFKDPVFLFSIMIIFYMTILMSVVTHQPRHTISLYGVVILWASYAAASAPSIIRQSRLPIIFYKKTR